MKEFVREQLEQCGWNEEMKRLTKGKMGEKLDSFSSTQQTFANYLLLCCVFSQSLSVRGA